MFNLTVFEQYLHHRERFHQYPYLDSDSKRLTYIKRMKKKYADKELSEAVEMLRGTI